MLCTIQINTVTLTHNAFFIPNRLTEQREKNQDRMRQGINYIII